MLEDPLTITVNAVPIVLPRTGVARDAVDYTSAGGTTKFRVQQTANGSTRRTSAIMSTVKIAADPISGLNSRKTTTVSVTWSAPLDGFTTTELKDQLVGLATYLTASSAAKTVKILDGEK